VGRLGAMRSADCSKTIRSIKETESATSRHGREMAVLYVDTRLKKRG
jgi:hypothetical protein